MYLSRRMHKGGYAVYRQGLAEVLQKYNKVERKAPTTPVLRFGFGGDYNNQMGLKFSNPVYVGKYLSNGDTNSRMPSSPPNPRFNFPSWGKWVIGSVISLVLSFWNNQRMQKLKQIKGEAELAVEGVEAVAEMVEKVASATEEMAEEMAEKLPEKSRMKQVALVLEHISEVASHEAHLAQDFLHKVEKVTQDLDDLEAMIEPLVDKIVANDETKQQHKQANSESP